MEMQLKAPSRSHIVKSLPTTSCLAIIGNAGLRRPSDVFALKSSFFSPSLNLLISPQQRSRANAAPRFSMRVASKQAYICRDCGYPFLLRFNLGFDFVGLKRIPTLVAAAIFTMRELPSRKYLISISVLVNHLQPSLFQHLFTHLPFYIYAEWTCSTDALEKEASS